MCEYFFCQLPLPGMKEDLNTEYTLASRAQRAVVLHRSSRNQVCIYSTTSIRRRMVDAAQEVALPILFIFVDYLSCTLVLVPHSLASSMTGLAVPPDK